MIHVKLLDGQPLAYWAARTGIPVADFCSLWAIVDLLETMLQSLEN